MRVLEEDFWGASSDWHFQHRRIVEYCPWNRPWENADIMTERMVDLLNQQVPTGAKVLFTGDGALSHTAILEWFPKLNFDIYWAVGNHDKCHKCQKGWAKTREMTLKQVPNVKAIEDEFIVKIGRHTVLATHMPWLELSDERHGIKYAEYRPKHKDYPGISWMIGGHQHNEPQNKVQDRFIDVGWDPWGRAVEWKELEEIINEGAIPTK